MGVSSSPYMELRAMLSGRFLEYLSPDMKITANLKRCGHQFVYANESNTEWVCLQS